MRYHTSVHVNAPLAHVWAVLTDVARWPEWTPSVREVRRLDGGPLAVGSRTRIHQPRLPAAVWRVTELAEQQGFTWQTVSGGVTTVAGHRLAAADDGVTVTFSIEQTGLLAPLVGLLTAGLTRKYVDMEARGLRQRCTGG
ncbi:SRPBCC family protein [Goodfellowiella coeruleoviolacea]|uniref:Polyketide cyclase / dehydrase and lipid transport n=1 Tax=Goodfellowiella coeruleoviolacea TaxID=334858 RepID=A0AAE3G9D0_9PSEU|nr:SRPBCC family protein [Goodfellowiella coeruleoviolacea]MCP2164072.1 Polyketide cyclase / dehydrase and lipid transport [Goodfellowiella coeruleoviolacea]